MNDDWEMVNRDTNRMPVPGGWIYRVFEGSGGSQLLFVPAPVVSGVTGAAETPEQRLAKEGAGAHGGTGLGAARG